MVDRKSSVPLPVQIKDDVRGRISCGKLKPGEKLPSEDRLAVEYGVSRMTMRQSLGELAAEGLLQRIPGRGFFTAAGGARPAKAATLADSLVMLVVPDLRQSFFHRIILTVEKTMARSGYALVLRSVREDGAEERACLNRALEGGILGLMLVAGEYSRLNRGVLEKLKSWIPVVLMDVEIPGLESDLVVSDDRKGGFLAAEHLIELGHRNIVHLAGPENDSSARERLEGYRDALKKYGIRYRSELVRFTGWHAEEGYYETKKAFLGNVPGKKCTAIFAANDELAAGAINTLCELRLKVPRDVAVVGYGDMTQPQCFDDTLTTVSQPAGEMGKIAARLLMDKLEGRRNPADNKTVRLPVKLVVRQSCGIRINTGEKHGN